jgi:hypothetical protein
MASIWPAGGVKCNGINNGINGNINESNDQRKWQYGIININENNENISIMASAIM